MDECRRGGANAEAPATFVISKAAVNFILSVLLLLLFRIHFRLIRHQRGNILCKRFWSQPTSKIQAVVQLFLRGISSIGRLLSLSVPIFFDANKNLPQLQLGVSRVKIKNGPLPPQHSPRTNNNEVPAAHPTM